MKKHKMQHQQKPENKKHKLSENVILRMCVFHVLTSIYTYFSCQKQNKNLNLKDHSCSYLLNNKYRITCSTGGVNAQC